MLSRVVIVSGCLTGMFFSFFCCSGMKRPLDTSHAEETKVDMRNVKKMKKKKTKAK